MKREAWRDEIAGAVGIEGTSIDRPFPSMYLLTHVDDDSGVAVAPVNEILDGRFTEARKKNKPRESDLFSCSWEMQLVAARLPPRARPSARTRVIALGFRVTAGAFGFGCRIWGLALHRVAKRRDALAHGHSQGLGI